MFATELMENYKKEAHDAGNDVDVVDYGSPK
jgi:hypothetical protein